jgi:hypothetical protein
MILFDLRGYTGHGFDQCTSKPDGFIGKYGLGKLSDLEKEFYIQMAI